MAAWDYGVTGDVAYHKIARQTQAEFTELNDQAEWGSWYWSASQSSNLTYQSGVDNDVRSSFAKNGRLSNGKDNNFRPIRQDWPVFAFAQGLSDVSQQTASARFSIGLCQDQAIQFKGAQDNTPEPSLWKSYFPDELSVVSFFHNDWSTAVNDMNQLDDKVRADSQKAGGDNYYRLTALSVRQAFGGTQLVGTKEKPAMFLKEISSDGNVQTGDVIFPMHPILLYFNSSLLKLMMDPLFEAQEATQSKDSFAIHDLGASYPNATGHADGRIEQMPIEESGNMIIMALAYAQRSNDNQFLNNHYPILQKWNQVLIQESLFPQKQNSTDDFNGELG